MKKKAIIYVRGHNQEMQEITCRLYAAEMGYKVLFVTDDINAVNGCDVLLVVSVSRISRDRLEYEKTVHKLKAKEIQIVSVANQDNADECISLAMDLLR